MTGGALVARTRRPSGEFGVRGRFTLGSFGRKDGALSIESPVNETLAFKLDLLSKDRDGIFDTPAIGGEQGHSKSWTVRPMFSWSPTEDIHIEGLYEVIQHDSDGNFVRQHNCTTPTRCVGSAANTVGTSNFDLSIDFRGDQGFKVQRGTVEGTWDIGPGTLTSITGWRDVKVNNTYDVDGRDGDFFQGGFTESTGVSGRRPTDTYQWQISSELRYATQVGENLDFTTGVYYQAGPRLPREPTPQYFWGTRPRLRERQSACGLHLRFWRCRRTHWFLPLGGAFGASRGQLDHQSWAWFVQGDYHLTDRLTMTLGTRWTWEEKVAKVWPSILGNSLCNQTFTECESDRGINPATGFDDSLRAEQDTWNYWSRHGGLRYQVTDDLMVYGSYTRSFRAGGFNLRASNTIPLSPYDEERIDAYEFGLKGDWLDNTLRTNLVGFYNRGNDIQRTILVGVIQDQKNAAKGHVAGVEGEVTWLPIEGLTLNSTVGWVDAEYDSFSGVCSTQTVGPCTKGAQLIADLNVSNPGEGSGTGGLWVPGDIPGGVGRELDYAYVPEWTWSANGRYEFPVPVLVEGTLALQASVYWRDDTWGNDQNTVPVDSYTIWDASITYFSPDDRYSVSVFGKNLSNDPYHNFGAHIFGNDLDWNAGPPRRFGIEVAFTY